MLDGQEQNPTAPVADFHLLGRLDFDHFVRLQRRLVYDAASSDKRRITVLLCEHSELITVGRGGSRAHVRLTNDELRRRRWTVRWVNRGGGCLLHGPGQLAIYPIVPLRRLGWTVGDLRRRLQLGLCRVLDDSRISTRVHAGYSGIWGRTGLLAAIGVGVQDGVSCYGAAVNVNPPMTDYGYIDTAAADRLPVGEQGTMSCLLAERRLPARMAPVRAATIVRLAEAFSCEQHHIHSGHPWLRSILGTQRERIARAS